MTFASLPPIGWHCVFVSFLYFFSLAYGSTERGKPNISALKALVNAVVSKGARMYMGSFPSEVRPEFVTPETVGLVGLVSMFN